MIIYLEKHDASVDVPDDFTEQEIADLNNNFSQRATAVAEQPTPTSTEESPPDFFQSHIEPWLAANPLTPGAEAAKTPEGQAFGGKAIEHATFGIAKPFTDRFEEQYKDHPIYAGAGMVTGEVGSLLATGGVLRTLGLTAQAAKIAAPLAGAVKWAPRFVAPAISTASTFGTQAFIKETTKQFQEGNVDLHAFGSGVMAGFYANREAAYKVAGHTAEASALGAIFGGISGITNAATAITTASGLGFAYSKAKGADNVEAALNGAIWGIFEAVGSFGREVRLRNGALNDIRSAIEDYVAAKKPSMAPGEAKVTAGRIFEGITKRAGGVEAIAKSGVEGTLGFIEGINQKIIRLTKVKTPTGPERLTGKTVPPKSAAESTELTTPNAALPPDAKIEGLIPGTTPKINISEATHNLSINGKSYPAFVSKNPKPGEKPWRVTYFDPKDGQPINHFQMENPTDYPTTFKDQHGKIYDISISESNVGSTIPGQEAVTGDISSTPKKEITASEKFGPEPGEYAEQAQNEHADRGVGRNYGGPDDIIAEWTNMLGDRDAWTKLDTPEAVKFFKEVSGNVPKIVKSLYNGYFRPKDMKIAISHLVVNDPKLLNAVLWHEIGHFIDMFGLDKTLARGNILGRISSAKGYRKTLLSESPISKEQILTDADRARFRAEAKIMAAGAKQPATPSDLFDPQAILNVFNTIEGGEKEPSLLSYIKGLDTPHKKAIVVSAMQALKKREKVLISDIKNFNKAANADPKKVAEVYEDLIRQEIKKRKLFEEEVIKEEAKALSLYWKPFDVNASKKYTAYRHSSSELYADFISVLLNAPGAAKKIAPTFYRAFFNYVENKPEVLAALMKLQARALGSSQDLQEARFQDMYDAYNRAEDKMRRQRNDLKEARKSIMHELRLIFDSKNSPIYEAVSKLKKKELVKPEDDAKYIVQRLSMLNAFIEAKLLKVQPIVNKIKDMGLWNELGAILELDRSLADRAELGAPGGRQPHVAKDMLDHLQKKDPRAFQELQTAANGLREWFREISFGRGAEDVWTKEQIWTMALNDKYAPFRVIKYMKDYVAAGFQPKQMGTLEEIGHPGLSLIMKGISVARRLERNYITNKVIDLLLRSGVEMIPAKNPMIGGRWSTERSPKRGMDVVYTQKDGKWYGYHMDQDLADTLNRAGTEDIGRIAGFINHWLFNNVFRALWITFSPPFQLVVNPIRDFWRLWHNTPKLSFLRALKLWGEGRKHAKNKVAGELDSVVNDMLEAGAFSPTYSQLYTGRTTDDVELETLFQQFGLSEGLEPKFKGVPVMEQIIQLADMLRIQGEINEATSKIVGWMALDHIESKEERAYMVRNYVGTPNFKEGGKIAPLGNSIFMFSNVFLRGMLSDYEAAFLNPKTRGGFWRKKLTSVFSWKIVMAMIALGMFGKGCQDALNNQSEYVKSNYLVIPLGVDKDGNGIALKLPTDETSRILGGIFWKTIMAGLSKYFPSDGKGKYRIPGSGQEFSDVLSDVMSFGAGQFPGFSPLIQYAVRWFDVLLLHGKGGVLTETERIAGGSRVLGPMIKWSFNETGVVRMDVHEKMDQEPTYKSVMAFIPILPRIVSVSQQGKKDAALSQSDEVKEAAAKRTLEIQAAARKAIKSGEKNPEKFALNYPAEEHQKASSAFARLYKGFTSDPYIQLSIGKSNDQKVAIFKEATSNFADKKAANEYLVALYKQGIINDDVFGEIKRGMR